MHSNAYNIIPNTQKCEASFKWKKIYLLNNEVSLTSKFAFIHSYHIFPFYGKCITLKEVFVLVRVIHFGCNILRFLNIDITYYANDCSIIFELYRIAVLLMNFSALIKSTTCLIIKVSILICRLICRPIE